MWLLSQGWSSTEKPKSNVANVPFGDSKKSKTKGSSGEKTKNSAVDLYGVLEKFLTGFIKEFYTYILRFFFGKYVGSIKLPFWMVMYISPHHPLKFILGLFVLRTSNNLEIIKGRYLVLGNLAHASRTPIWVISSMLYCEATSL